MESGWKQRMIEEIKEIIMNQYNLSALSDEELQRIIREQVNHRCEGQYVSLREREDINEQIFSSMRGFGLLDLIIRDEAITEVMINGPKNIFIEKGGHLFKLEEEFES